MLSVTPTPPQRGMTLIELMVAMVLGLVTTLIVAQVMINADSQNRTTTSGSDAQINGATALYMLSQTIQSAGYGLIGHSGDRGCPINWPGAPNAAVNGVLRLLPVEIITPAAEAGKAVGERNIIIRTFSSGAGGYSAPRGLDANTTNASNGFIVGSTLGLAANTVMMAARRDWSGNTPSCLIFSAGVVNEANRKITPTAESLGADADAATPDGGFTDDDTSLVNLGTWPDLREYQLDTATNVLRMRRFDRTSLDWVTEEVARGIVRMVAYYGIDDNSDGAVDRYTPTAPNDGAAGWGRVINLRLAIVARSDRVERPENIDGQVRYATSTPLQWIVGTAGTIVGAASCTETEDEDGTVVGSVQQCLSISLGAAQAANNGVLAADPDDWRNYRYKLFDTVIPLRNQVWSPA